MRLNEKNDKATIKKNMEDKLPGRGGKRNLKKSLKRARQLITPAMGDRLHIPNVCVVLSSADSKDLAMANQSGFLGGVCDYLILMHHGNNKELQKVPDSVCPNGEL